MVGDGEDASFVGLLCNLTKCVVFVDTERPIGIDDFTRAPASAAIAVVELRGVALGVHEHGHASLRIAKDLALVAGVVGNFLKMTGGVVIQADGLADRIGDRRGCVERSVSYGRALAIRIRL